MFGKFCARAAIGVVVATIFSGGEALGLMAAAVVCTAGLGLIVVLPAIYLIGLACTIWFIPFGSGAWNYEEKRTVEKVLQQGIKSNGCVSLADYIVFAQKKGKSWETIQEELEEAGWAERTIEMARQIVSQRDNSYGA